MKRELGETGMASMQFARENMTPNEVGQSTEVETPSAKGGKALILTTFGDVSLPGNYIYLCVTFLTWSKGGVGALRQERRESRGRRSGGGLRLGAPTRRRMSSSRSRRSVPVIARAAAGAAAASALAT